MNRLQSRHRKWAEPCNCLRPLIRGLGLITSFVICGVGVDVYMHGYIAGLFILFASLIIMVFETKWIVTIFLKFILTNENWAKFIKCWGCFRVVGGWRLSPPYIAIGIALILWPHNLWLSYVAGAMLIILAILRLCTLIRFRGNTKNDELLSEYDFDSGPRFGRGDDYTEVLPNLEDEEPIDDVC